MLKKFVKSAQGSKNKSVNFKIFFYSLWHKDLGRFRAFLKSDFSTKSRKFAPIIGEGVSSMWACRSKAACPAVVLLGTKGEGPGKSLAGIQYRVSSIENRERIIQSMDAVSFIKERSALADAGDWQTDKYIWSIAFTKNARLTVVCVNLGNLRNRMRKKMTPSVAQEPASENLCHLCNLWQKQCKPLSERNLVPLCLCGEIMKTSFPG